MPTQPLRPSKPPINAASLFAIAEALVAGRREGERPGGDRLRCPYDFGSEAWAAWHRGFAIPGLIAEGIIPKQD